MLPPPDAHLELAVNRIFAAPREKVFRAWTEPDLLKKWMGGSNCVARYVEVDLRTGGYYRFDFQPHIGDPFTVIGMYEDIQFPEKLVFTWRVAGTEHATLVTVEFVDHGSTTEVILQHERFPSVPDRERHYEGWCSSFDQLAISL